MLPYVTLTVLLAFAAAVSSIRGLKFLWWILPLAVLTVFAGIRYGVGTDFELYHWLFLNVDPNSYTATLEKIPQEVGFVTLMFVTRIFSENYQVLLAVCSFLTVFPVLLAVRRKSQMPVLTMVLYVTLAYYPLSLNAIRQSIAVSLLFLAETYRGEKRSLWLLLSLLAVLFHSSSVVVFIIFSLVRRINVKLTTLLVIALIAGASTASLMQFGFVQALLDGLNDRYLGYLETAEGAGLGTVLVLATHITIIAYCVVKGRAAGIDRVQENIPVAYYILSVTILMLATGNWVIGRFEPYFGLFGILALSDATAQARHRLGTALVVGGISIIYMLLHISAYNGLVPYQTIWS